MEENDNNEALKWALLEGKKWSRDRSDCILFCFVFFGEGVVDFATPYAAVKSRRVVLTDRVAPATLVIRDGRIAALLEYEASRDRIILESQ